MAKRRKGRLYVLKKVLGPKRATLVATSGVLSAATYGAAVNGVSDAELRSLRRIAASAMTPSARGRSLSALLLLHGDPCWSAAVAPLAQCIRSAWKANEDEELVGRGINCEFMAAAWNRNAAERMGRLLKPDGTRIWGRVQGPTDALALSLHRIGWHAVDAFRWCDDLGICRDVREHSPELWKIILRDAVQRSHGRELAVSIGLVQGGATNRVCLDVPRHVIRL